MVGGLVGGWTGSDYNATSGPNWSAEAELMISWVGQLGPGVAIIRQQKKNGVDPPKIGPVPLKSKFRQKMSNMTTSKIAKFDLVHENGSN